MSLEGASPGSGAAWRPGFHIFLLIGNPHPTTEMPTEDASGHIPTLGQWVESSVNPWLFLIPFLFFWNKNSVTLWGRSWPSQDELDELQPLRKSVKPLQVPSATNSKQSGAEV